MLVLALVLTCGLTWFARQNHFEWMFNPLPKAAYAKATEAGFVTDNDLVVAVEIGGEAVAYPIRLMAYHHVVADTVGGLGDRCAEVVGPDPRDADGQVRLAHRPALHRADLLPTGQSLFKAIVGHEVYRGNRCNGRYWRRRGPH